MTWVPSRKNKTLTDDKKYTISGTYENSTLVINNVDKDDNGEYFCVATNPVGEILKLPFYLTVPCRYYIIFFVFKEDKSFFQ